MKRKILGILVCTLLFTTAIPVVGTMNVSTTRIIRETLGSDDQSEMWIDENYIPLLLREEYEKKSLEAHQEITDTRGWYWKSPYPNYAPSGMPDFSQQQDEWKTIRPGDLTLDSLPYLTGDDFYNATKNCIAPGQNCMLETPVIGNDYSVFTFCGPVAVANCFWWFDSKYADSSGTPGDNKDIFPLVQNYTAGVDDHSTANVPLLVCELARAMNVCEAGTTQINDLERAIDKWLIDTGLSDFTRETEYKPTFEYIADKIESGHDVILQIGFRETCYASRYGGHFITCAGVNSETSQIAISDPDRDKQNPSVNDHNDAQNVSHDIFTVKDSPCANLPYECYIYDYVSGWYTFIERAIVIFYPNRPPDKPDKPSGETSGKVGNTYTYFSTTTDFDGDKIYYWFDWDDGTNSGRVGPYASGVTGNASHAWSSQGTYQIKVKAKDIYDAQSIWSDSLSVNMPRTKNNVNNPLQKLFSRFTNLLPILRLLLQQLG